MKAEQFKQLIRAIVQEEIKKTLPTLVPQIVAEALSGKSVKPSLVENDNNDDFFESLKQKMTENSTSVASKPKQQKKFSSNPLLNQVLNETEGGVPQDVSFGTQMQRSNFRAGSQPLNIQTPASPILNEETKAQAELGVFKDYRKLMKAVDVKKKQGAFGGGSIGGLSIDAGVPSDFSTID
jgi:hypothetical protein